MSPELELALLNRYPRLLRRFADPQPIDSSYNGMQCGDGWYGLISALLETLDAHERPPDVVPLEVVQIKAKFGSLRVHLTGGDEVTDGMRALASAVSTRTCELCGRVGAMLDPHGVRVLCAVHSESHELEPLI